jgi:hypothetical protein
MEIRKSSLWKVSDSPPGTACESRCPAGGTLHGSGALLAYPGFIWYAHNGEAKTLARGRLRAVAVDGKTSRRARRADGTRVHLLGIAEHGGHPLDQLEVDVNHNETGGVRGVPLPGIRQSREVRP